MTEESTGVRRPAGDLIGCALCEEEIPRSHSILTEHFGRICHFCYKDEKVGTSDDWDEDWDDVDWDDADLD